MSNITHNDELVTKTDLSNFYQGIYPYLNGAAHAGFTPVGTLIAVMGNSAPANYLACEGQIVNIADYKELADYFEAQFGTKNHFGGDGTTTFAVPDLRGEFLRGTGTNGHANQGNGANVGGHQDGTEVPAIFVNSNNNPPDIGIMQTSTGHLAVENADYKKQPQNASGYGRQVALTSTWSSSSNSIYTSRPTNTSVLYCIATKNIYIDARFNYSTDEKIIGTWIDGKPLYQKTISCGALPNNTSKTVAHGISNIGQVVNFSAVSHNGNSWICLFDASSSGKQRRAVITANNVQFYTQQDDSLFSQTYVTILYTKTTD